MESAQYQHFMKSVSNITSDSVTFSYCIDNVALLSAWLDLSLFNLTFLFVLIFMRLMISISP
jgi:hypothetical protein